jgi:hypothetical protein
LLLFLVPGEPSALIPSYSVASSSHHPDPEQLRKLTLRCILIKHMLCSGRQKPQLLLLVSSRTLLNVK